MGNTKVIRKNVNFPVRLLAEVDNLVKELGVDFSKFIQRATEEHINNVKKIQIEKELEEGYKAKAKLNRKICEYFKYIDGENI